MIGGFLMGLFDFFKRSQPQQEEVSKVKFWSLSTNDDDVVDPTWDQVQAAVENAVPDGSIFATLAYNHSGLELDSVQTVGEDGWYRFEALEPDGKVFVNDGISYEETLRLFKEFFNYQTVVGYRSWPAEKR